MKKIIAMILAVVMLSLAFVSCNGKVDDEVEVRTIALKGPTGMGMAKLMDDKENGKTEVNYSFTIATSPTEVNPEVLGKRVDIAAVPINLAPTLLNKGADISVVAVNTLSVLYILENGNEINSFEDLRGKTIYAAGQGSTPEYIFRYLLEKNGISDDEVEIIFCADGSEVASNLVAGKATVGLIPEPNVTSALASDKSGNVRIALDINEEWKKVSDTPIVQGVIIASNDFIRDHKDVLDKFLEEYKSSVDYVNENLDEAAALIEKFGIVPKAAVAKKALPNCNICCYTGAEAKTMISDMLSVLYSANPASIGGEMPSDGFYYEK